MTDQLPSDEINFIDLIVVLIRYRLLIIGTVLISTILSLGAVLIIPKMHQNETDNTFSREAVTSFFWTPDVQSFVEDDVLYNYISQTLTDPKILLYALRQANLLSYGDISLEGNDEKALQNLIRNIFSDDSPMLNVEKKINGMELSLKIYDSYDYISFFNALLDSTNKQMIQLLRPYAEGRIWEYKNILNNEYPYSAFNKKQQGIFDRYTAASRFYALDVPCLMMIQDPFSKKITVKNLYTRKKVLINAVIVSFSAIFISIIISFVLAWIDSIKTNPRSMEKLRKAIRKERG